MTSVSLFSLSLSYCSHIAYALLKEKSLKNMTDHDSRNFKYVATPKKSLRKIICIEETVGMV